MAETDRDSRPGMPRWVKVMGIVAAVVILGLVILFVATGGEHGPRRHAPSGETPASHTPPVDHGP